MKKKVRLLEDLENLMLRCYEDFGKQVLVGIVVSDEAWGSILTLFDDEVPVPEGAALVLRTAVGDVEVRKKVAE